MAESDRIARRLGSLGGQARRCHSRSGRRFSRFARFRFVADTRKFVFDAARELELPQPTLESYLRSNIDFSLDEENRRAGIVFRVRGKLGLIPPSQPIEWATAKAEAVKL